MWKNELRKMITAAIGHVHPILIKPISFACEGDRSRFVALSWRACDLGERADCDAHRNDFTHVSRRGVWFLHKTHNLISYAKDCCSVDDPTQLAKRYSRVILESGSQLTLNVVPRAALEEQRFTALGY